MIDHERRSELENAVEVLTRHNLYRRGYCDMEAAEFDPKESGKAIDAAAGAILEYLRLDVLFDEALKKVAALKTEVGILEHEISVPIKRLTEFLTVKTPLKLKTDG